MALIVTPGQLKRTSEFYRELGSLMSAGVPAIQALQTIERHPPGGSFRGPVSRIIGRIQNGSTLTESITLERDWLPAFDLALLQAGEISGRLVESCRSLSEHYAARARLIEGFIVRTLYPVFLVHLAVLVFPPERLPQLVLQGDVAGFVGQKLSVLLPAYLLVAGLLVAMQSRRSTFWRTLVEQGLRVVPFLGKARHELALARLAGAMEALISAGVGVVEAWDLAAEASGSPALRRAVRGWRSAVLAGDLPSDHVRASREFPQMFASLYFSGETSGQLDQELRHLNQYFLESGQRKLNGFVMGASVAIMLGVMLSIAFFIIRFWMNYFNQISNAAGF